MKNQVSKSQFLTALVVTVCISIWVWPLAAAQKELSALTTGLPGSFELTSSHVESPELLSGAIQARTNIFSSGRAAADGNPLSMQYIDARYEDQAAADVDFEQIAAADELPHDQWKIVLQAQDEMHWMQAACSVFGQSAAAGFRRAYANLVSHAEAFGVRANRALLCGCESACMTVAIDR